jgi:NAD(P)-dependent dehydrogenase (short-subunit alcohol dehydrogenase family)
VNFKLHDQSVLRTNLEPTVEHTMPVALVTGASRGLGRAFTTALAERGWTLVIDGRDTTDLIRTTDLLRAAGAAAVYSVAGDVSDPEHRVRLRAEVDGVGGLDLLVNNASTLGSSPMPSLVDIPLEQLQHVYTVNTIAPLAMVQALLPHLRAATGRIVNITSDAAVEPYPGWGGYGSSKAALEQLTAILAAEVPTLRVYAFDPGDMRTRMHQDAYPGEDISDRPAPEAVVPALLRLVDEDLPSGRFRASDLSAAVSA